MNKWTRRAVIATGGLVGGGLALGVAGIAFAPNRLRVTPDNRDGMPQPNFVPVRPSVSRSTQSRGVSSSTSAVRDSPLTSRVICMSDPPLVFVAGLCA